MTVRTLAADQMLHGGQIDIMRKCFPSAPKPWLDLSTGINPRPYPCPNPDTKALQRLPTQTAWIKCRNALAARVGASEPAVCLTPGSEIAIRLLPQLLPAKTVAILDPTYGDHAHAWARAGAQIIPTSNPLTYVDDLSVDAIVICNPNNPDARRWKQAELQAAANVMADRGATLIIDEAYADLCPEISMAASAGQPGLVILRSFGKFFGLPGLRLGAVLAQEQLIDQFSEVFGVWGINPQALEIARRAYKSDKWHGRTRGRLAKMRSEFVQTIEAAGATVTRCTELFYFTDVGEGRAAQVWNALAQQGVYVRQFPWTNRHLRIGLPGSKKERVRFGSALEQAIIASA